MKRPPANADRALAAGTDQTRRQVLATVGISATMALTGCTAVVDPERRTTTVQHDVTADLDTIAIDADDAETTVEARDDEGVSIRATKYAVGRMDLSDVTVTRDVTDGRLDVGVERTDGFSIGTAAGGLESLTVGVPDGVLVTELAVDDGDAVIEDVAGDLALTLDDGTAEVGPLDGELRVDGDEADVTVAGVASLGGELDDGVLRTTEATTIGDVQVDDGELDLAVGDVTQGASIRADDGDVTVRLSPSLDLTVDARVDDGSLRFEDGVFDEIEHTGDDATGRIGDGSDRVTVEVDDGTLSFGPL